MNNEYFLFLSKTKHVIKNSPWKTELWLKISTYERRHGRRKLYKELQFIIKDLNY